MRRVKGALSEIPGLDGWELAVLDSAIEPFLEGS
jgi:hypothetical protein